MVKSSKIDCANRVQNCPPYKHDWKLKNNLLKCTRDEGYVCIKDSKGHLYESCMANFTIQANSGNCPVISDCLRNKPVLGSAKSYFPCPGETQGCPPSKHDQYSIYQLVKYPKCIESSIEKVESSTSMKPSEFNEDCTTQRQEVDYKETTYIASLISLGVVVIILTCTLIFLCDVLYSKKRQRGLGKTGKGDELYPLICMHEEVHFDQNLPLHEDNIIPIADEGVEIEDMRRTIHSMNETKAKRVPILPLKEKYSSDVDRIYLPMVMSEEFEKRKEKNLETKRKRHIPLNRVLNAHKDRKLRFILMLGEAGYGKTVQCQQITESWCTAWTNESFLRNEDHLERSLREYDFLFLVRMRDVHSEHTSILEMVIDAYMGHQSPSQKCKEIIRNILQKGQCKSLVLLDGLDEWNIKDEKKQDLKQRGIPNYSDLRNCTILITMRSSNLTEVKNFCYQEVDRVVRLNGFDEDDIMKLAKLILCNLLKVQEHSQQLENKFRKFEDSFSKLSLNVKSLIKIPMLAVFCIRTLESNLETVHSMTTFYLALVEMLIERNLEKENEGMVFRCFNEINLKKYGHVSEHMHELSSLGKIAFSGLHSQNQTLTFSNDEVDKTIDKTTLDKFLNIGLLSKVNTSQTGHQNNIRISFLHKTVQEFLASLYLWQGKSMLSKFLKEEVIEIERALQYAMVLKFLSGLSPAVGCEISRHIVELAGEDNDILDFREYFSSESYEKVFYLYDLQVKCFREVRGQKTIKDFHEDGKLSFLFSDIILHGKDTDKDIIIDTKEILRYHTHDILSLQMKFIVDHEEEGISNKALQSFLDNSRSIGSLNIDGYVRGHCRLFNNLSARMSNLSTLGLHNVAFTGNTLTDLFTKRENEDDLKNSLKALGLFYIRHSNDLHVKFSYQFSTDEIIRSVRSGNEPKTQASLSSRYQNEIGSKTPLLKDILNSLPDFHVLSTLHVSYMDSLVDRKALIDVIPLIKSLDHFGYHGSSIIESRDNEYDASVIKVILDLTELRILFLSEIIWENEVPDFTKLLKLRKLKMQDFQMDMNKWEKFVPLMSCLTEEGKLENVYFTDTNIHGKSLRSLQKLPGISVTLTDERSTW